MAKRKKKRGPVGLPHTTLMTAGGKRRLDKLSKDIGWPKWRILNWVVLNADIDELRQAASE